MTEESPRAVCYDCHKPAQLCVCARIPRVANRTGVIVLQHPRERLHHIGTARFARLGLERVRVEVAWSAGTREHEPPPWLPPGTMLLYPAPGARDLAELPPAERPEHLVVLDGTWHTARTLYRDKEWLHRLPHVRLTPAAPSNYRIRREPSRHHVSTIEAIVEALLVLEPDNPGPRELLAAFDAMIDDQLVYVQRGSDAPRTRERRPREWRGTPTALVEHFDRLVVTYLESSRQHPRGERELVHLAAVSLSTGAVLERIVRPSFGLPSAEHLAHMQLRAEDFEEAVGLDTLRDDLSAFLRASGPDPLLAAWNQGTLDLLAGALGAEPSRVSLKSAYRNVHGSGSGSLEEVVAAAGLDAKALPLRGRAGLRVARAVAIAQHLNRLAHRPASETPAAIMDIPSTGPQG